MIGEVEGKVIDEVEGKVIDEVEGEVRDEVEGKVSGRLGSSGCPNSLGCDNCSC